MWQKRIYTYKLQKEGYTRQTKNDKERGKICHFRAGKEGPQEFLQTDLHLTATQKKDMAQLEPINGAT